MDTIELSDGTAIPQLGYGVCLVSDEEIQSAVESALEAGYRSIDTASIYRNEDGVGRALAATGLPREELYVTTKLWATDMGAARTAEAFHASREKLGLDYVDLYLIHWPAPATDAYLESWEVLEELKEQGWVRSIGVSNFLPEHLDRVIALGGSVPVVNQVELHPALRNRETEAANTARGIVTEAWSPLARGAVLADPVIGELASRHGRSPAQIILRWHLQQGRVVIPKSVTPERIRANIDVFGFELSGEELARIDALDQGLRAGDHPATFNP